MVHVGDDEFCTKCMEWRTYDAEGKCKVCGKQITKKSLTLKSESYGEYERGETEFESEPGE